MKLINVAAGFSIIQMLACSPSAFQSSNVFTHDANDLSESKVIDGETITNRATRASRSVVAIELTDKDGKIITYCTGALIGPQTILTASHCFSDKYVAGVTGFNVIFETRTKFFGEPVRRKGSRFAQHPQFNTEPKEWIRRDDQFIDPSAHADFQLRSSDEIKSAEQTDHDLAVGVFEGKLPSGFEVIPIDTSADTNYAGQTVYFYGYGRAVDYLDEKGKYDTSTGQLRKGIAIVDTDYTQMADRYFTKKSSKNSLCQGDSGGPQFYSENGVLKIIGVNSAVAIDENSKKVDKSMGEGLFSCRSRSQVAKVGPYADWVRSVEKRLLNEMKTK